MKFQLAATCSLGFVVLHPDLDTTRRSECHIEGIFLSCKVN